jgi:hypothetical protein
MVMSEDDDDDEFCCTMLTTRLARLAKRNVLSDSAVLPEAGEIHVIMQVLALPPKAVDSNLVNLLFL